MKTAMSREKVRMICKNAAERKRKILYFLMRGDYKKPNAKNLQRR
jgi:hypothetical protein